MYNNSSEKLAVFGKNRYNDWVILFFGAVGLVVFGIGYNYWLYINTKELVSKSMEVVSAPSKFEDFKKDVETVSAYIESSNSTSTLSIPRDPSLR